MNQAKPKAAQQKRRMGVFERYLSVWVVMCIAAGTLVGNVWPEAATWLSKFTYAQISVPVAVLIWLMIYPMMLQIDFTSLKRVGEKKNGLIITTVTNWLVKPFTMYAIAWFFLNIVFSRWIPVDLAREYLAGAVLLGAAPCTAMVFVWSYLADGDPAYTLVQVAVNDLILLFAFAPIVMFLLGLSDIMVPYDTVILSVALFVVVPLVAGWISRVQLIRSRGIQWFEKSFLPALAPVTITALLATLVIIFIFQGQTIVANPLHILLIAIPLTIQTYLIFAVAYGWSWLWRLPHRIAAPAGFVGASNFFELSVAVAISLFGLSSGATLATVVGVLVEVPVMLSLVWIAKRSIGWIERRESPTASA
ncbi:MAG: ACR3 family arsenite efflux transporter [Coriobacteriia bacterium]|nr:ACR3 family arsenite efflux transporter [Coriobacteriia bacterium]MDO9107364.1 ACR3 family arsenite efflux transporter [Coriobacteriia bacterium]